MSEEQFPMLTRVGIIGDVHGQVGPLRTAVTFLRDLSLDALVCTGDLPPKGYTQTVESAMLTNECALLLRDEGVLTVRGNHDRYFVENADDPTLYAMFRAEWDASGDALAFARSLPAMLRFQTPGGELLLCHGVGADDRAGIYPAGEDAPIADALTRIASASSIRYLIAGHTHCRLCRAVAGTTILNPGALVGDKEPPGFAVADFGTGTAQFYVFSAGGDVAPCGDAVHWVYA